MRVTGIVRRIDDLGRVVIPKEIRNTLGKFVTPLVSMMVIPLKSLLTPKKSLYASNLICPSVSRDVYLKMPPKLCAIAKIFTSLPPMFTNLRAKSENPHKVNKKNFQKPIDNSRKV